MIQKIYFFILLFFMLVVLNSCTSKQIKNEMYGSWYISRIRVDEDPCVYYKNFSSQFMDIKKNGNVVIPAFHKDSNTEIVHDKQGQWDLVLDDNKTYFQIKSEDSVFSGLFRMKFLYNPQNKRIFLELISENVYILAARSPLNEVEEIFSPTKRNSKDNRYRAVVRLSGGDFVNYDHAPFDTCPDFDEGVRIILL